MTPVPPGAATEMRAEAYGLLADVLSYPDSALWLALVEGSFQADLCCAVTAANPGCAVPLLAMTDDMALTADTPFTALESIYLNAFELDAPSSPCPLYEGAHRTDIERSGLLLEVKAFYQHFGLAVSEDLNSPEDHLSAELEFMAFLAAKQADAERDGRDSGPYLRAQRDFLSRHLGRWVPILAAAAERKVDSPFYRAMCRLVAIYVAAEEALVTELAQSLPHLVAEG